MHAPFHARCQHFFSSHSRGLAMRSERKLPAAVPIGCKCACALYYTRTFLPPGPAAAAISGIDPTGPPRTTRPSSRYRRCVGQDSRPSNMCVACRARGEPAALMPADLMGCLAN